MSDTTTYKVGDPDPSSQVIFMCQEDKYDDVEGKFCCTRNINHDGPHIAGDGNVIHAIWGDDA